MTDFDARAKKFEIWFLIYKHIGPEGKISGK